MFAAWTAAGARAACSATRRGRSTPARGRSQVFQRGELWALGAGPRPARVRRRAHRVEGRRVEPTGGYGYPLTDTTAAGDGQLTCTFEGGTITA